MEDDTISLDHGSGGLRSNELIRNVFLPVFKNKILQELNDSAVFYLNSKKICFSTDSYVVNPLFFPGGDIGSLSIHGTVNDLSVSGSQPLYISTSFILEEGFSINTLKKIVKSMHYAASTAQVKIVTGDTKVVPKGAVDKVFINTSGIGIINYAYNISPKSIVPGDAIIVSGNIASHGAAIMNSREQLKFNKIISDSASLNKIIFKILKSSNKIHCMRDVTRGGLGCILVELATQANVELLIEECLIPIDENVKVFCEMLGMDPLFLANEGMLVLFCDPEDKYKILDILKNSDIGNNASIIGYVEQGKSSQFSNRVLLQTIAGGTRTLFLPSGEIVPRIC